MSLTTSAHPTRSFRTVPIILDLTNEAGLIDNSIHGCFEDKYEDAFVPPSPIRMIPPGRSLRRKKDMSIKRFSAPPASPLCLKQAAVEVELSSRGETPIYTPPLTSDSGSSFASDMILPEAAFPAHHRTQSQPTPAVKLGHPSRPYYTAIRPRPTSVIGLSPSTCPSQIPARSAPPSRPVSLSITPPEPSRFTSSAKRHSFLDVEINNGDVILPTPSALSPPAGSLHGGIAFSLPFGALVSAGLPGPRGSSASGETEMRMASGDVSYTFVGESTTAQKAFKVKRVIKHWRKTMRKFFHSKEP